MYCFVLNKRGRPCRRPSSGALRRFAALAVAALLLVGAQRAWAAFPTATGYVTDAAQVLDAPATTTLTTLVGDVEQQTTAEIAIGEIIRTNFTPAFAKGDYAQGITQGVQRIAAIVRANHTLSPEERRRLSGGDRPPELLMIPFFGIFVAIGAFAVGVGLRSKTIFPLIWGGMFGGIPMAMAMLPFFNASLWILGPLAVAMCAWGYAKGESATWKKTFRGGSGSASSGGWVMGGSDGSSGGGSSGGGSFGGGSSGGGGASGSW